jgi:hypothetical protein
VYQSTITDVVGSRGEKILDLCLTDLRAFNRPLFRPAFLGDKWPTIDFYVELPGLKSSRPYFFVQVKTTQNVLLGGITELHITASKRDVERLRQIPGPTYVAGVHEPTGRVFLQSVHANTPTVSICKIQASNELTAANLKILRKEVMQFWRSTTSKPSSSNFL